MLTASAALGPLVLLYGGLRQVTLSERLVEKLTTDDDSPSALSRWTNDSLARATRIADRYGFAQTDATRVVDLAASFVIVKLLLPVRLYACMAWTPMVARRLVDNRFVRRMGARWSTKL